MDYPIELPSDLSPLGIEINRPAPGTMVLYGRNGRRTECFNLNSKTNCTELFYGCQNIDFPEGVTFESCTNATNMFAYAKNITFPETVTFEKATSCNSIFAGSNTYNPYAGPFSGFGKMSFNSVTSGRCMFMSCNMEDSLTEATFKNITDGTQMFNGVKLRNATVFPLPKATFAKITTSFGNLFWAMGMHVDMPEATFAAMTSGGSTFSTSKKKFNMPKVTWEKLTTAFNKKSYLNYYIFPMLHLNLKALTDGTGMFHGDGMDLETLRTIVHGPTELEDPNKGLKDISGGTRKPLCIGLDKKYDPAAPGEGVTQAQLDEISSLLQEIENRGWTLDLEYNIPTVW